MLAHGYFLYDDPHELKIMKPYPPLGILYISSYLKSKGLSDTYWIITHPEVTDLTRLDMMHKQGLFKKIFISDTIPLPREYFIQVPTSRLMARLIYNVHTDQSISDYLL